MGRISRQHLLPLKTTVPRSACQETLGNGPTWRSTVTPNTVIEFDFQSDREGEIHAVGFDTNDSLSPADPFFQLYGTQVWWGNQAYHNYDPAQGPRHYTIPIGKYFTGSFTRLVFANDDDAAVLGESVFSNIRLYERTLDVEVNGTTASYALNSYGGQDLTPASYATEDNGSTLRLSGNTWKRLNVAFTVTPNTVLEFDFQSVREGEIHAVGFDTNDLLSPTDHYFQLYGTQSWWGNQALNDYDPAQGLRHYVIPLGEYFTGSFTRLVFANDDDAAVLGESVFGNIRLYESGL